MSVVLPAGIVLPTRAAVLTTVAVTALAAGGQAIRVDENASTEEEAPASANWTWHERG